MKFGLKIRKTKRKYIISIYDKFSKGHFYYKEFVIWRWMLEKGHIDSTYSLISKHEQLESLAELRHSLRRITCYDHRMLNSVIIDMIEDIEIHLEKYTARRYNDR